MAEVSYHPDRGVVVNVSLTGAKGDIGIGISDISFSVDTGRWTVTLTNGNSYETDSVTAALEEYENNAAQSAINAAAFDGPRFNTKAHAAAYDGYTDGKQVVVWSGYNGEPETYVYDADSELTADGALVVDATGMGAGRLISTRTTFSTVAEMLADVRTFADGTKLTAAGFAYDVVSSDERLTTAGGVKLYVLPGADGKRDPRAAGAQGDGVADDWEAVQTVLLAGPVGLGGGDYLCSALLETPHGVEGPGVIRAGDNVSIFSVTDNNVVFEGLKLVGSETNTGTAANIAIEAVNKSGVEVVNCEIVNARTRIRNTDLSPQANFRFIKNKVTCDFSSNDYISAQNDVITVRGIDGVWVEDNEIEVVNCHRVLKLADTEAWTVIDPITEYRCRNVFFRGNKIRGSTGSGKQVVDMFSGTTDAVFSKNNIKVSGFGRVIENKTDSWAQDFPLNIKVKDNHLVNDGLILNFAGTLGDIPSVDVGFQNVAVSGNTLIVTGVTAETAVIARWLHELKFTDNTVVCPDANRAGGGAYSAIFYSCEHMQIEGSSFNNSPAISEITSGGDRAHAAPMKTVVFSGNTVTDWNGSGIRGGVVFRALTASEVSDLCVTCNGNTIYQESAATVGAAGCLALDSVNIKKFLASGNVGASLADSSDERIRLVSATVGQCVDENNSWNLIGAVTATYDPPSIASGATDSTTLSVPGAATGDFVEVSFSRVLSGVTLSAEVSATNTVTILFCNGSGSAVDLGSGTLNVRVKRHAVA